MRRGATFSSGRRYRYALWREWSVGGRTVLFIGLNPSTADHRSDDPTIRRCIAFARSWGFGRLVVANLFAYRATDPRDLLLAARPIGPRNNQWLARLAAESDLVIAAWGVGGRLWDRGAHVQATIPDLYCLGQTKAGFPRHPLYVRGDVRPIPLAI